jgi:hypothetical protein
MCSQERSPAGPPGRALCSKSGCRKHLETSDDLTLEEHSEAFEEHFGQRVSTSTVGRAISGLPDGGWPLRR